MKSYADERQELYILSREPNSDFNKQESYYKQMAKKYYSDYKLLFKRRFGVNVPVEAERRRLYFNGLESKEYVTYLLNNMKLLCVKCLKQKKLKEFIYSPEEDAFSYKCTQCFDQNNEESTKNCSFICRCGNHNSFLYPHTCRLKGTNARYVYQSTTF